VDVHSSPTARDRGGQFARHHGHNKTRHVYSELGLQLRDKMLKRRVKAELCDGHKPATRSNGTSWQRLRVLTILDIFSRFSPALKPRFSSRRSDVVAIMEGVSNEVGIPATIRVDQGSESCRAIWICRPTAAASRWTSHDPENQPTMRLSKRSTVPSGPNA
jgi:hypothetical protein